MKDCNSGERNKVRRFFNAVAVVYPFIEKNLAPTYSEALVKLDMDPGWSVLDLATGTGILAGAFARRGHEVEGLDFADNLLRRARKQFPQVKFRNFDLVNLSEIPDNSHAIVCMGFLLHGLDAAFRLEILSQARRIASRQVLVFDYGREGNFLVKFIEWVEGPHYPGFLAASRSDEFAHSGLNIISEFDISQYGHLWACTPVDEG